MTQDAGWLDEYALGIPEMDAQHHAIFDWLEILLAATKRRQASGDLIKKGRRHSAYHFGAEETFLTKIRFPGLVKQRVQHRQFLARLDNILARIETRGEQLSLEQGHELQSWLKGHILGLDREYADYWFARDVEPPAHGTLRGRNQP